MKISIFSGKQSKNGPGVKALQFASLTVLVTLDYLQPFVCLSVSLLTTSHNIFLYQTCGNTGSVQFNLDQDVQKLAQNINRFLILFFTAL